MNDFKRRCPWTRLTATAGAIGLAIALAACAATSANHPADSSPARTDAAVQPSHDPYPGVNTVARDRGVWQQLLSDHARIRRVLRHSQEGGVGTVESLTESDDPEVAARIIDHAKAMQARMRTGATVRIWDPVFRDLFKNHAEVTLNVTPTPKGVKIVESCAEPDTILLMRSHAIGVSAFVRDGHTSGSEPTPRLRSDDPLPPDEVAIGGLPHRFLLSQPTPEQVSLLRAQGVQRFVNFRKPEEHQDYDEAATVTAVGATYCNIPYRGAAELTDDLLSAARAEYAAAARDGIVLAPHCSTGNRVGPGLAAYLAIDLRVDVEQAIGAAKAVGMADASYERITREYIRRTRAARG